MMTVGLPGGMILPTGEGIGATHVACWVRSPTRAAGRLLTMTELEPLAMIPGPAGTHDGSMQILDMSDTRAAAMLLYFTLGDPGGMIASGRAGCGTGVGVGAGGWIGA